MTEVVKNAIVNYFGRRNRRTSKDLVSWAKTEYGSDWQYALQHMIDTGQKPREYEKYIVKQCL